MGGKYVLEIILGYTQERSERTYQTRVLVLDDETSAKAILVV